MFSILASSIRHENSPYIPIITSGLVELAYEDQMPHSHVLSSDMQMVIPQTKMKKGEQATVLM